MKLQEQPEWTSTWRWPDHKIMFEWIPDYSETTQEEQEKRENYDEPDAFRIIEYPDVPGGLMVTGYYERVNADNSWEPNPKCRMMISHLLKIIESQEEEIRELKMQEEFEGYRISGEY